MRRFAVIGSGVSGLTAAHILSRRDHVTLYEAQPRLGGHAHTHTLGDGSTRVDTGFIVHNDRTYPHLLRLFGELGVATRPTEMSMSISDPVSGIEYAGGKGVRGFLARPRQLANPTYLRVLSQVRRFHRTAAEFLAETTALEATRGTQGTQTPQPEPITYGAFIRANGFDDAFLEHYAVPLVSCVWSSGRSDALDYPAQYLFRFLANHGMLSVGGSPQWRTVVGGSAAYVDALAARLPEVRRGVAVTNVKRTDGGVLLTDANGQTQTHDAVVVATHADQALALLADPTPQEREVLSAFRYSSNETVLHRDSSLMPRARGVWASWNHLVQREEGAPVVTYWMNRLQGIDLRTPLFVTLNASGRIRPDAVIATMTYEHPVFDAKAVRAQQRIAEINTRTTVFAGAYQGWGFHEDGCASGVRAAQSLGVTW